MLKISNIFKALSYESGSHFFVHADFSSIKQNVKKILDFKFIILVLQN